MKPITVFTPAFNRAHLLPRLYKSLVNQTNQNFIWMVIDDGSSDDTQQLIDQFKKEQKIEIEYIYQENQGMHGAHNTAYKNINTELNTCIDSDDFMPSNSIENILTKWEKVKHNKNISGIAGLDADLDGNIIGTKFKKNETTLEDFYLNGGKGDKQLVYRTKVMQQYPEYPLFKGEKYVGLAYKYLLADKDYQLATLNEVLIIVDYQDTGSSNNMFKQYRKNPRGFAFLRKQNMIYSKSLKVKFRNAIHYVSSSIILKNGAFLSESPKPVMTFFAIPFGVLLYFLVLYKTQKESYSNEL